MVFREEKEVRREKYLGVMCCFRGNTVILSIRVRLKFRATKFAWGNFYI
jgi:hypothetical protein